MWNLRQALRGWLNLQGFTKPFWWRAQEFVHTALYTLCCRCCNILSCIRTSLKACPRVSCQDQSCLLCTLSLCRMWFLSITVTITSTLMTLSCPKVHHPIGSLLFCPVFRHVLMMLWSGWKTTSLSWTQIRQVMPVGSASRLESVDSECANTGGNSVPFSTLVKYLGVHLDRTLSKQKHISSISSASLELRRIASIRPYLSQSAAARLLQESRLDYCNSVFTGLPADQIARLQRVQNNAARLVMEKEEDEITEHHFSRLHWLPLKSRCQYKIATLAYSHLKDLNLFTFLHLSALMNRLVLSGLLMKSCCKFQGENSSHSDNAFSVSWHHLFEAHCRPL